MPYKDPEKQRAAQQRHYQANKDRYDQRQKYRRRGLKGHLYDIKSGRKCLLCPEDCYAALTFHHLDPTTKSFTIGGNFSGMTPWRLIVEEMEKCVLVCHNCHAKLHINIISLPEGTTPFVVPDEYRTFTTRSS